MKSPLACGRTDMSEITGEATCSAESLDVLVCAPCRPGCLSAIGPQTSSVSRREPTRHAARECEAGCTGKARVVLKQGCLTGVTRQEKACLGGSW